MVLVDRDILAAIDRGAIIIDPFDRRRLGTNSYDVTLAPLMRVYNRIYEASSRDRIKPLDAREENPTHDQHIWTDGYVLEPGELYLASTVEYTESHEHLPIINGRSSLGRLGLSIHVTAGTGDVGFRGNWTLELTVVRRLKIYAGMAIGQLLWMIPSSAPDVPYDLKPSSKYGGRSQLPQASLLHREHERG